MQDAVGNRAVVALHRALAEGRLARKCGTGCGCESCGAATPAPVMPMAAELVGAQLKAKVSMPGDPLEREADTLADRLVDGHDVRPARATAETVPHAHAKPRDPGATPAREAPITPARDAAVEHLGGGAPLPASERSFFEPRLGDLGGVRVHAGDDAAQAASTVNARAFTLGRDIVFGAGEWRPGSASGRRLLAHELVHYVQQGGRADRLHRTLTVDRPGSDAALQPLAIGMMKPLLGAICPDFDVNPSSGVVSEQAGTPCATGNTDGVKKGKQAVGCCCVCTLVRAKNGWRIVVTNTDAPTTDRTGHLVRMTPAGRPDDPTFRHWTAPDPGHPAGQLVPNRPEIVLAHELCGHGALTEVGGHPIDRDPTGILLPRDTRDLHDPTVRIENAIAGEQTTPIPAANRRALAREGIHRGESIRAFVVQWANINEIWPAQLSATEHAKLDTARDFIRSNAVLWVEVIGHTDTTGTTTANDQVSRLRARNIRAYLRTGTPLIMPAGEPLAGSDRFRDAVGRGATEPPPPGIDAKRVEILLARYPAGAQSLPPGTPIGVTTSVGPEDPARRDPLRLGKGDPCAVLLVQTAWP